MWQNYKKYRNTKVKTEEHTFDSRREYVRWLQLKDLEEKGEISDLRLQVPYELIPTQYIDGKCVERSVVYKADFVYLKDGETIVEDTKGVRTKEYVIKRKLMLHVFGIRIREV